MDLRGQQTWVVTGASKGFGRALTQVALEAGDRVVAAVRDPDAVADLVAQAPDRCAAVTFDAADIDLAPGLVDAAVERFGRVDVLVNNAGRALVGAAKEVTDVQLRELMELHLFGPAALVRAVLPLMRGQGGRHDCADEQSGRPGRFPGRVHLHGVEVRVGRLVGGAGR